MLVEDLENYTQKDKGENVSKGIFYLVSEIPSSLLPPGAKQDLLTKLICTGDKTVSPVRNFYLIHQILLLATNTSIF